MEAAAVDQELKINLAALRKSDRFVLDILETSAQVALYKFDPLKQKWVSRKNNLSFAISQNSVTD